MNFLAQILQKNIFLFIGKFSKQVFYFSGGNKASNIEIAIASCKIAKKILYTKNYNSENFAEHLLGIQNLLGCAYCSRIKGERAKNLEIAIKTFKLALKFCNRENSSEKWAEMQTNLGITYSCRIRGNKANNLKEAIRYFYLALKVCKPKSKLWAKLQNEIGNAYLKIEKEGKLYDLLKEAAIKAFDSALLIFSSEKDPYEWAITQNNLGNAYRQIKKGDKDENTEKAIIAYKLAL